MFQDLPDYFTLPDEKNKDLYQMYKNNIVGGPSIVAILWLFTNSAKIHLHGVDVMLAGVESHHWQFLQMSFKLLVYLEEVVLLLLAISLFILHHFVQITVDSFLNLLEHVSILDHQSPQLFGTWFQLQSVPEGP
jgi:hypothetical protein